MKKENIIKNIALRLGNVRGLDSTIELELATAIDLFETGVFHPWFLLSQNLVWSGLAGEWKVPLPEGFLMEYEEGALFLKQPNGNWCPLIKAHQDDLKSKGEAQGTPTHYTITNGFFRLFPTPAADFEVEMMCYLRSEKLESTVGVENVWYQEAANWLIHEVCMNMLESRRDKRAGLFEAKAIRAKMELIAKDEERKQVNFELIFGGE